MFSCYFNFIVNVFVIIWISINLVDAKMDEVFVDCLKVIDWKKVCP